MSAVPLYYFNLCCDSFEATDVVGQPCANDVDALAKAMTMAGEVVQQRLRKDQPPADGWIEVEDGRHRQVLKLPLRAAAY